MTTKHIYSNSDIIAFKNVIFNIREISDKIENDAAAMAAIDNIVNEIEDIISMAEDKMNIEPEEHANSSRKNYKEYMAEENATTDNPC